MSRKKAMTEHGKLSEPSDDLFILIDLNEREFHEQKYSLLIIHHRMGRFLKSVTLFKNRSYGVSEICTLDGV